MKITFLIAWIWVLLIADGVRRGWERINVARLLHAIGL